MSKLIATINFWSDSKEWLIEHCEMLRACGVDYILVLSQITSNYGIKDNSGQALVIEAKNNRLIDDYILFIPNLNLTGSTNEKEKRKLGVNYAKQKEFDYILLTDTDEFYLPNEFKQAREYIESKENLGGLIFQLYTYYKRRTLRTENVDGYFICGIFRVTPTLNLERPNKKFLIDPTRRLGYEAYTPYSIELYNDCIMHHYSWIRENIKQKIESSSARANIKQNKFYEEFMNLEAGSIVGGNKLIEVNYFI